MKEIASYGPAWRRAKANGISARFTLRRRVFNSRGRGQWSPRRLMLVGGEVGKRAHLIMISTGARRLKENSNNYSPP